MSGTYRKSMADIWQRKLERVAIIYPKLEKEGYKLEKENVHEFDYTKAHNSHYPQIRVNGIILVECFADERLRVSSVRHFPLMGEEHTVESFNEKMKSWRR